MNGKRPANGKRTERSDLDRRFEVSLRGVDVDATTRCVHYNSALDVIAVRFPCCDCYYPCFACHEACCDHDPERWPPERFDEPAVLCGNCRTELPIETYLDCKNRCPVCNARFNPGCRAHRGRYFAVERS